MIKDIFKFSDEWIFQDESESEGVARWANGFGDILSVNYFPLVPDIEAPLNDTDQIRSFYRKMAEANGIAPVEINSVTLKELAAIRTIYKLKMEPTGFAFLGSYTLPFSDRTIVIKIQCVESGITGMRESAVLIIEDCKDADEETGMLIGWEADPYDPSHTAKFMANKADAEKYDAQFPEHPLSRVRAYLNQISETLEVNRELYELKPFIYGASEAKPKWWKFWG